MEIPYFGDKEIIIKDEPKPELPEDYVYVKVKACGICGGDVDRYLGKRKKTPTAGGHELSGIVKEVGAKVDNDWLGKRVCAESFSHCGNCVYCKNGKYQHCLNRTAISGGEAGGYAEYALVHPSSLFKIKDTMSFKEAALAEPLAVAYHVYRKLQTSPTDSILIIGAGAIGLCLLAVCKIMGSHKVLISAKYEKQIEVAQTLKADEIINYGQDNLLDIVFNNTEGEGTNVVIEATSSSRGTDTALKAAAPLGKVGLLGIYFDKIKLDLGPVVGKELKIYGSNCYSYHDFKRDFEVALEILDEHPQIADNIITHTYPLSEIDNAFATAADKEKSSIRVMLTQE